jgi:hypothetical protein
MFNLWHKINWTVLQLQMDVQKFAIRYTLLHNRLFCGRGRIAQPVSGLSSIWIVFCNVIHELKRASPLKSGISLSAWIHWRCVLYQDIMIGLVLVFELTLTTEHEWMTPMQVDLNMLALTELKVNLGLMAP